MMYSSAFDRKLFCLKTLWHKEQHQTRSMVSRRNAKEALTFSVSVV